MRDVEIKHTEYIFMLHFFMCVFINESCLHVKISIFKAFRVLALSWTTVGYCWFVGYSLSP